MLNPMTGEPNMAKDLTTRVMELIDKADPLERLRFLLEIREETPAIRAVALGELLEQGLTRYRVAQELGVTPQAVQVWDAAAPRKGRKAR
jgi:hypothetical protein